MSITLSFVLFVLVSVNIVSCSVNTLSEVSRDSSIEDIAEKMQGALEPNCKVECSKNLDIAFGMCFARFLFTFDVFPPINVSLLF